jgi:hypothetical protein
MKNYLATAVMISAFAVLTLAGCGGGGGGAPAAVTQAVTKVYLFGNMSSPASFGNLSSNCRIASVQTSMTIPQEVMLNYSTAPGATSGFCVPRSLAASGQCILRDGIVVPSGKVLVSPSDFTPTYDFDTTSGKRTLTISMLNNGRNLLKTNSIGNGAEIATINFKLVKAGTTPAQMPLSDLTPAIGEELPDLSTAFLVGRKVNFVTTYQ